MESFLGLQKLSNECISRFLIRAAFMQHTQSSNATKSSNRSTNENKKWSRFLTALPSLHPGPADGLVSD
eukprot:m.539885 g.539885  ORF g.539885 m.539885 type:complete len:69 (+) comp57637_c0_seq2:2918-3124(+)